MPKLIPCRSCGQRISSEAKACPSCGDPNAKWWQPVETKNDGLVKFGFAAVLGLVLLLIFSSGEDETAANTARAQQRAAEKAEREKCGDEIEALTFSQLFVKKQLKAPSTANFGYLNESTVKMISCGVWSVKSYVDAENAFSAKLRKPYFARLEKDGTSWKLHELKLE